MHYINLELKNDHLLNKIKKDFDPKSFWNNHGGRIWQLLATLFLINMSIN